MSEYKLFGTDETFEAVKPTIRTRRAFGELAVKASSIRRSEREELARYFGWNADVITDELPAEAYDQARATLLFPGADVAAHFDDIDLDELERAQANFIRVGRLPLKGVQPSFLDLTSFLTQALQGTAADQTTSPTHTNAT